MDCDERQMLHDSLSEEYQAMFASMDDAARAMWFLTMDESVILGFYMGKGESLMQAEKRHAIKLQAIATALGNLPCAEKEQRTIEDLRTMANAIHMRHDAASSAPTALSCAEDPYAQAMEELRTEGKL